MVRTNQGGSILSFAILGGIMALLLIGGAYFVRHNLAPAERTPQVATTDQQDDSSEQNQDDDKPAPANNSDKPKETPAPQQNVVPKAPDSTNNNSSSESAQTPRPAPVAGDQSSGGLPSTGPSSALFGGFMLSGLVALAVAYAQSRRILASL
jgi:cytoskeletal protein RodZ